jgi:hypothetical protein
MNTTKQERNSWIPLAICLTVIFYYGTKTFGNDMLQTQGIGALIIQASLYAAIASTIGLVVNHRILIKRKTRWIA